MSEKLLWMREVYIKIDNGLHKATYTYKNGISNILEIHFNAPFSDEPKPNECTVDIYNLSKDSINKIKKKSSVSIEAGYKGDIGLISKGKVTKVITTYSGVDKITTITFLEGIDYTDKKDVNITFKKGTKADAIIKRVASVAKIPISQMKLPNNKVYTKGYTADGDAIGIMEEVVKACGAAIYFRRGNLIIRSIKTGDDERFTLNASTGLISMPERVENDEYTGWNVNSLLQHRIATASIIKLDSKTAKGTYRVKSGVHSFDGSNFSTQCEVV